MPRWASRLTLEVTEVRVERVQDITDEDARAEGTEPWRGAATDVCTGEKVGILDHIRGFREAWDTAYPGSWDRNDWVWVVRFRPLPQETP